MKPWYSSKKIWIGVATGVAAAVASVTGRQELGDHLLYLGMALIGAFGLQDVGKH